MNIKLKNIPKFQGGGVPQWYLDRYGNRTALLGWNLNKRYNYANQNLNANDHRNAGNLDTVYRKNTAYTGTPGAVTSDIQAFYNSDGKGMTAEDFVNFYNQNAAKIRGHWALDRTYNASTAGDHNRLYRRMFVSRSNQSLSPGSDYNIGYLEGRTKGGYNMEDIEGSSTWLRRMDLYEKEFDPTNPDSNRLHEITLSDGSKAVVYKKANGDIGLLPKKEEPVLQPITPQEEEKPTGSIEPQHKDQYGFDWNQVSLGISQMMPNLLEAGRHIGALYANNKIYEAKLKGIKPTLILPYYTHRQVVGDEATKLAYYRRAALGETKAAKPFTADADRLMAYMMEAKRIGDEARALGDLADNAEIRRTSDESNQHQWANTQRATEVANNNLAQLNYANAAKLDLLALKYAADHSSWDNYIKGIEYRARLNQAEDESILRQLWALEDQRLIENDALLNTLYKLANEAYEKDPNSLDTKKKMDAYKNRRYLLTKMLLENSRNRNSRYGLFFGARGMKITRKKKDDLLYKSARDVVEHFRRMSKMSDDSTQRSRSKSYFKLAPHPGAAKMQQGGVAPFVVYTPLAMGGETSTTVSSSTSSSKSSEDKGKETLDLIKSLFLKVSEKGLPIDVSTIYKSMSSFLAKLLAFGTELSTNDIASMYLLSMLLLNNIRHSQEVYEKAKAVATQNDALGEFAVTSSGLYIVQDLNGKLSTANLEEIQSKHLNPITNELLLLLRAYSPELAFAAGDNYMENVINNGIGLSKIADRINQLKGTLGNTEKTIEGYTRHETDQIKRGLELLAEAPSGDYKFTRYTKDQKQLMLYAFDYIKAMLPKNMKAVLNINAFSQGTTMEGIIGSLLNAGSSSNDRLEFDAVTGKASKDSNGNSGKGDAEGSAGLAFVLGLGPREVVEFNTGTSYAIKVNGIKGVLQTHSKENLGLGATLQDATKSQLGGYLLWNKATFGGSKLNFNAYNHIILNDSTIMGMDLPYTTDLNGNTVPDFQLLRKMEEADEEIRRNNILSNDYASINLIYLKHLLPPKYTQDGLLITLNYKRFAAVLATLDEKALLNSEAILSDEVALAGDVERDLYEEAMKKLDKNYNLGGGFLGLWEDKLYKGTIFIPYDEDVAFAAISSGSPLKQDIPNNAAMVLTMQYAPATLTYKAPSETLSQIKSN